MKFSGLWIGIILGISPSWAYAHSFTDTCEAALLWRLSDRDRAILVSNVKLMGADTYYPNFSGLQDARDEDDDWSLIYYHGFAVQKLNSPAIDEIGKILLSPHSSSDHLGEELGEWAKRNSIPYAIANVEDSLRLI